MGILAETLAYYRQRKYEQKQKAKLVNSKSDWGMLEQLVQKCNDNPNLKIEVFLNDGTRLLLKTTEPQTATRSFLDSEYEEIR